MSVRHHPDDTLLLAYAAGRTDCAMALILATHLSFCGQCRACVALGERIGGAVLEEMIPVPLAQDALTNVLARLDAPDAPPAMGAPRGTMPAPLRAVLSRDLSGVRWRKMGPRLGYVTLYRRRPLAMRLLRGAPGSDVGQHTHRGMEYSLVLQGGFTDITGHYGPGDFQTASGELKHNPVADPDGDCVILSVTTGPLRFDSLVQKIAGRLFGF